MKLSPYYLSAEARAVLAARSAEIRADLARRREARDRYRKAFDFIAYGQRIGSPFTIGGVVL